MVPACAQLAVARLEREFRNSSERVLIKRLNVFLNWLQTQHIQAHPEVANFASPRTTAFVGMLDTDAASCGKLEAAK